MNKEHDVEYDYAGFSMRPRLTCHTCEKTLLKQPYMSLKEWSIKVMEFSDKHPSEVSRIHSDRLEPARR